jgi:DNA-binding XRE family transcriptional regulator
MITGFQLKAAKAVLDVTAKEIAEEIKMHPATIVRLCSTKNLAYLPCSAKNVAALITFFKVRGISFNEEYMANSIALKGTLSNSAYSTEKMTRFQLKAARIATNLTQESLSSYLKISSSSLSLLEKLKNNEYIEASKIDIYTLKRFFEHLGIAFPHDLSVALIKDPIFLVKKN